MFFTPVSARVACAIVARGGACITRNSYVVWHVNIADFPRIFASSAGNARTFPPGLIILQIFGPMLMITWSLWQLLCTILSWRLKFISY